jgi:hypothetical protein
MKLPIFGALIALSLIPIGPSRAEDLQTFSLTLKAHRFAPAELHVQAGKPFFWSSPIRTRLRTNSRRSRRRSRK